MNASARLLNPFIMNHIWWITIANSATMESGLILECAFRLDDRIICPILLYYLVCGVPALPIFRKLIT